MVVGDLVAVERDIEVDLMVSISREENWRETLSISYANEHTLALEIDIGDGKFVGERHGGFRRG